MADNTPNFDAMSPEEIMAWMESLAKRQGADQGFTTSADVEIAEIDPDSVVIDEPGYVPPEGSKAAKQMLNAPPPAPKPAVAAKVPAPAPKPAAPPPEPPPAAQPVAAQLSIFDEPAPAQAVDAPDWLSSLGDEVKAQPLPPAPEPTIPSGLSWLESLAVDSGAGTGEIDLSLLGAELPPLESEPLAANPIDWLESLAQSDSLPPEPVSVGGGDDPVDWLDALAQGQGVVEPPIETDAVPADDPINWLESLARGQGARAEEFTTAADLDIPPQETAEALTPGYTEYTYETPGMAAKSEPPKEVAAFASSNDVPKDPAAWLDSLAAQAFGGSKPPAAPAPTDAPMSDNEIQQALKRGDLVPHDQMEAWMQRQLQEGAQRTEPEELAGDYDPDAPPVKADLPDWLLEQVGTPMPFDEPDVVPASAPQTPALIETILEPPDVDNIPDWLKDEEPSMDELDSIFATSPQEDWSAAGSQPMSDMVVTAPISGVEIDPNDPWVEALEMEYKEKAGLPPEPMVAQVISTPAGAPAALQEASLPAETELPAGIADVVPDWLSSVTGEQEMVAEPEAEMPDWLTPDVTASQPAPAVASEVPDWLADVDIEPADIPDWLKQSITTTSDSPVIVATPAAAAPPPAAITPVRASPAPIPAAAQKIDVAAVLQSARQQLTANDIVGSLSGYEQLIRANAELDAVVDDLAKMADKFKTSAAVHRVLGDGLMRQGKLQAALDTYRKALNQL